MRDALARTGAEYLLLCKNAVYGTEKSFATALARGLEADGLTPTPGVHKSLLLLKVHRP